MSLSPYLIAFIVASLIYAIAHYLRKPTSDGIPSLLFGSISAAILITVFSTGKIPMKGIFDLGAGYQFNILIAALYVVIAFGVNYFYKKIAVDNYTTLSISILVLALFISGLAILPVLNEQLSALPRIIALVP